MYVLLKFVILQVQDFRVKSVSVIISKWNLDKHFGYIYVNYSIDFYFNNLGMFIKFHNIATFFN